MRRFQSMLRVTEETRILDVGGTPLTWSFMAVKPRVTFLNMPWEPVPPGASWIVGDGRNLPIRDASFDVVFSNSVIEHLGGDGDREQFAREISRAGARYWVQTPNRWFPVEQHMLTPFVHFLPKHWQAWIVRRFAIWAWITRPAPDQRRYYIEHYLRDIRLLDAGELRTLFPGCTVIRERFLGMTKSLIATGRVFR